MSRKPPLSTVLTLLRAARGWPQNELAATLGCGPSLLSDYEAGRKPVSRERVEEIAALLGLPPSEAVDCTLAFLRVLRSLSPPEGEGGTGSDENEAAVFQVAASAEAFARSLLALSPQRRAAEARREARGLWERMKVHPPALRLRLVEGTREFRNWALCELVCQQSLEAAADRADRALELARLAVRIAELAPGEIAWRRRLQGYALAHLANAIRVSGDLPAADQTFARARASWEAGAPDQGLLKEALVPGMGASLRMDQRRLPEALDLLDEALAIDKGSLRRELLISRARVLEQAGDFEGAIASLQEVAPSVSGKTEPRLLCVVLSNLANNLLHATRSREAATLLPQLEELVVRLDHDLDIVRLRWLKGRVAAALGNRQEAMAALAQVRQDFASREIAYDSALVTLELIVLYLEENRFAEVRTLARQILWLFQAQGVHREALAALRLFCEAAEQEEATLELAQQLVCYLYRARHDPDLRFETSPLPLPAKPGKRAKPRN